MARKSLCLLDKTGSLPITDVVVCSPPPAGQILFPVIELGELFSANRKFAEKCMGVGGCLIWVEFGKEFQLKKKMRKNLGGNVKTMFHFDSFQMNSLGTWFPINILNTAVDPNEILFFIS